MKVTLIGAGYVGLVSALGFCELGHDVVLVEQNAEKLRRLRHGVAAIHERGVAELLRKYLSRQLCLADATNHAAGADVVMICVGTPSSRGGSANPVAVLEVVQELTPVLSASTVLVTKSTVPVGTCQRMRSLLREAGVLCGVACNPEFLREGSALEDFLHPARIVVGADDPRTKRILRELYQPLLDRQATPYLEVSTKSAELMKHAANAFLAAKISFVNAIASIAENTGADIDEIVSGMALDPRIGDQFLGAGIGFGGSCFPKDLDALRGIAERSGYCFDLLNEVQRINAIQRQKFIDRVTVCLRGLRGKTLAVLGLSFKGGTDDVRCSPAIAIARRLISLGAEVRACDPAAIENARAELQSRRVSFYADPYEAMQGADGLVILTDWPEFAALDLVRVRKLLTTPIVIDGRNLYRPVEMKAARLRYISVGRSELQVSEVAIINPAKTAKAPAVMWKKRMPVRARIESTGD